VRFPLTRRRLERAYATRGCHGRAARPGLGYRHGIRRLHGLPGHGSPRARIDAALDALGPARPRSLLSQSASGEPPPVICSPSCRAACTNRCAWNPSKPSHSVNSRAMPWEGWRLASPRRKRLRVLDFLNPAACRSPAPLSDGGGLSAGHRRRRGTRHRHVRLRNAHPART